MRIAAVQHDIVWEDREANFERLTPQVARAVGAGAELVLLTETFSTGFSMTPGIGEPEAPALRPRTTASCPTTPSSWRGRTAPPTGTASCTRSPTSGTGSGRAPAR
jgi:predicted amidohydrolase